jgi:hypothetical protein
VASPAIPRDPEERAEGVEWVEPPIEAERELVEVGLQVLGADTVMDAVEPGLRIAEDEVLVPKGGKGERSRLC